MDQENVFYVPEVSKETEPAMSQQKGKSKGGAMLTRGIKLIVLFLLILFIAWLGTCAYANLWGSRASTNSGLPEPGKAAYSITIENTHNILFTNEYEQEGSIPGQRIYTINGFWEMQNDEFRLKDSVIILDEAIFGKITIRRR